MVYCFSSVLRKLNGNFILTPTVCIPFYDRIVPELQSGELDIQQDLKPKITPAKLTKKFI